MWVFSRSGFLSVVEHRDDPALLCVRARVEADLDSLRDAVGWPPVHEFAGTGDYQYRVFVERETFSAWLSNEVAAIDYTTHFKDEVAGHDPARYRAMMGVWREMAALQPVAPYSC